MDNTKSLTHAQCAKFNAWQGAGKKVSQKVAETDALCFLQDNCLVEKLKDQVTSNYNIITFSSFT